MLPALRHAYGLTPDDLADMPWAELAGHLGSIDVLTGGADG